MRSRNLFLKPRSSFHGRWWIIALLLAGLYLLVRSPDHSRDEFPWQPPIEPKGVTVQESDAASSPIRMQASTSPSELQAPASVVPQPATPAAQALSAVSETQASAAQTDSRDQVRQSIERWSRAWSARDVNTYLDAYARSFVPAGGQDKAAWEQTRRQRILSKSAIAHEIRNLQITLDGNKATARFEQTYTADHLRSVGPKTLQLELNGDKWLIVSESAS